MQIIDDIDAIQYLPTIKGRFAVYAGAGISVEAGVMSARAVCEEIRDNLKPIYLSKPASPKEVTRWEEETLRWNDPAERYVTCMYIT